MKHLRNAAKEAVSTNPGNEKIESLARAFEMFSLETVRLENAYDTLSEQFQQLNLELQDANYKLQNKVAELDVITGYLTTILDSIAQGILFIDMNGTITTCNPAAETLLGIGSDKIFMRRFKELFSDNIFGFSMKSALEKRQATGTYNVSYTSPNGHHSELEVTASFVPTNKANGSQTQGVIVMIRDITEVKRLQTIAARADRMKVLGEMAAQVAHEIRNPLGGIKGFATLLQRDLANQPSLQEMASYIIEGTNNLNNLVHQVLHYARPVQPHFEQTDVIALLREVKQHIATDANLPHDHVKIAIETDVATLFLSLDAALMKSALLNLIVNSIQAMPNGGTVTLSAQVNAGQAVIAVADTGVGIPEEDIGKVFSPFFTSKPDGNGLGLIEVQKVAQAHGGSIDFDTHAGRGTIFRITLPAGTSLNQRKGQ